MTSNTDSQHQRFRDCSEDVGERTPTDRRHFYSLDHCSIYTRNSVESQELHRRLCRPNVYRITHDRGTREDPLSRKLNRTVKVPNAYPTARDVPGRVTVKRTTPCRNDRHPVRSPSRHLTRRMVTTRTLCRYLFGHVHRLICNEEIYSSQEPHLSVQPSYTEVVINTGVRLTDLTYFINRGRSKKTLISMTTLALVDHVSQSIVLHKTRGDVCSTTQTSRPPYVLYLPELKHRIWFLCSPLLLHVLPFYSRARHWRLPVTIEEKVEVKDEGRLGSRETKTVDSRSDSVKRWQERWQNQIREEKKEKFLTSFYLYFLNRKIRKSSHVRELTWWPYTKKFINLIVRSFFRTHYILMSNFLYCL